MNIRYCFSLGFALILFPLVTSAGEKVSGTTFYVFDQANYPTGKETGYWVWNAEGIQHSTEGPLGTSSSDCHGAGFWAKDVSWGEGICLIGEEDDTRVIRWWRAKDEEVGHWEHVSGTGKYESMSGGGTYTGRRLEKNRWVSEWEGEVTFGE